MIEYMDFSYKFRAWGPHKQCLTFEELKAMHARGENPHDLPLVETDEGTYYLCQEDEQEELHINAPRTKERDEQMQTIVDMLNKFRDDSAIRR